MKYTLLIFLSYFVKWKERSVEVMIELAPVEIAGHTFLAVSVKLPNS
ncbi:hypothetical protein MGA3_16141 [Bacillus methanolicus MGA3]|uniref:Uncharacterized protein n=2 Tax=Bacillus methanolicus TaxID=1471 RepID=I3DUH6_BACMM|nr:hypothetical protein BMMGA3_14320 [Bacillus methanolicus MGA3]EIJ77897.1 hypothetical protein MGA3_16141 [Bacillus methanolicus MGA3]